MQETPTAQPPIPPQHTVYPPQPPLYPPPIYQPPPQPLRSNQRFWLIMGIVAVIMLVVGFFIGTFAGTRGQTSTIPPTTQATQQATIQPTQPPVTQPPQTNTIGKPVQVGNTWIVTVNSVKTHGAGEYSQPKSGNTYLVLDVTLKNISSSNHFATSMGMFSLKDQTTGQLYSQVFADFAKPVPDGLVSPGSLLRGEIVYEVPSSVHSFTISFDPMLSTRVMAEWNVKV